MGLTPIFIMATPRSGSTLVQRVLSTYREVASTAEPWVLLPPLLALHAYPPNADAWYRQVSTAIRDYVQDLPGGEDDYLRAVRDYGLRLYESAAPPEAHLFVDKSPPYHHVVDQLLRAFPDARFVFLWRNPLSVVSSTVETFCGGRWRPFRHRGDLFDGVVHLTDAYQRAADRVVAVRYEDLVSGEETAWRRVTDHVGLQFDPRSLSSFADVRFTGRMGDPTGTHRYSALSRDSVDRWKSTVGTAVRREWCLRYIRWLGRERLTVMGYDLDALVTDLQALHVDGHGAACDLLDLAEGFGRDVVRRRLREDAMTSPSAALLRARAVQ